MPGRKEPAGGRRKMAARLTPVISRIMSRNCRSKASALREWVRMEEKLRRISRLWKPPGAAVALDAVSRRAAVVVVEDVSVVRGINGVDAGTANKPVRTVSSKRERKGLKRTCRTPLR